MLFFDNGVEVFEFLISWSSNDWICKFEFYLEELNFKFYFYKSFLGSFSSL
jgi:hypothetical protein